MQLRLIQRPVNISPFYSQNAFQYLFSWVHLATALPRMKQSLRDDIVCDLDRKEDFQAAILSQNHISKFFPGSESWFPYDLSAQDLNVLMSYNKLYSVRYNKKGLPRSPKSSRPCALGYQYTCACPVGTRTGMYMWCNNVDEYKAFLVAMLSHVTRITPPGSAIVISVVSLGAAAEDVLDFTEHFLGKAHLSPSEPDGYQQGFLSETPLDGILSKL